MISSRFNLAFVAVISLTLAACGGGKPKPVSDSISKTTVMVNGKKDSVINNPQKNYGNASIAAPCVACLLTVIQSVDTYKNSASGVNVADIKYVVNYVKGTMPTDTVTQVKATNALRVDVINMQKVTEKIGVFVYDNSLAKLYSLNNGTKTEVAVDSVSLKKIRNGCYWGVASGR